MMFEQAVPHVLAEEGGYQANPKDKGNWTGGAIGRGELRGTKFGISAAAFPTEDIRALTRERAIQLYRQHYWNAAHCDEAPHLVRLALFDAAVNCGVGTAVRWLQQAAHVDPDGIVGLNTRTAWRIANPRLLLEEFMALRVAHHARDAQRNQEKRDFLPGWVLRCARIRLLSIGAA
jgi:lysozyme family protein